jgi:hypothetical protein
MLPIFLIYSLGSTYASLSEKIGEKSGGSFKKIGDDVIAQKWMTS